MHLHINNWNYEKIYDRTLHHYTDCIRINKYLIKTYELYKIALSLGKGAGEKLSTV